MSSVVSAMSFSVFSMLNTWLVLAKETDEWVAVIWLALWILVVAIALEENIAL